MRIPQPEIRRARIEIIPMIDTIFFLLVFFMITSLSMVKMRAMSVAVPKSAPTQANGASAGGARRPSTIILTVTETGAYYLNKDRTSPDPASLGTALQAHLAADPHAVVVLNFAKSQTTQSLISVMDTVNRIKTSSGQSVPVLIATEPIDKEGRAIPASSRP